MKDFLYGDAIQGLEQLEVGKVEGVSPSGIDILLSPEAPHNIALNTGTPTVFPRINSYLLIPNENGSLVGMVSWLGIRKDSISSYKNKQEDILGMSSAKRNIHLIPLGILKSKRKRQNNLDNGIDYHLEYSMERGTIVFPTVGDAIHIPTRRQLETIAGASKDADKRIHIGTLAHDPSINVTVDPDKLFGRHLAILGNTGSGKSCTVAGLIRWSIEAAKKEKEGKDNNSEINTNFIILDVNGEYAEAFQNYGSNVLILNADHEFALSNKNKTDNPDKKLKVPCRIFTKEEWGAFSQASAGVQYPFLIKSIMDIVGADVLIGQSEALTWNSVQESLNFKLHDQYISPMIHRLNTKFDDPVINRIINGESDSGYSKEWIEKIDQRNDKLITIIDLSLLSDEALHLIVSVMARKIFEAQQEVKRNDRDITTILVLEEAHRFVSYSHQKSDEMESLSSICSRCFSRIAREGRKFGLNLVVSSQMPHDISSKVLSQCNTFLLHRIASAEDQKHVKKLVPDTLSSLMDELPSLPSQYAFLLGHATPMPKLVKIKDLADGHRPDSADPAIWDSWIGKP